MKTCQVEPSEEITKVSFFPRETCATDEIIENWFEIGLLQPETLIFRTLTAQQWQQIAENPLTERELCVLKMLAQGNSNLAIAQELHIKLVTVKAHVQHIFRKLNVSDAYGNVKDERTQAAVVALRAGLVD